MPSPFPGMDPYLEGYLWPDVHHRLSIDYTAEPPPPALPEEELLWVRHQLHPANGISQ